jgi:hypothetical protein
VTLALVVSLVLVVAGGVLLVVGGTLATAIAMSMLGIAGVIWVSLAFFAVGRSEDREREASAAAAARAAAAEQKPGPGPVHSDERPDHRFRRRPG